MEATNKKIRGFAICSVGDDLICSGSIFSEENQLLLILKLQVTIQCYDNREEILRSQLFTLYILPLMDAKQ